MKRKLVLLTLCLLLVCALGTTAFAKMPKIVDNADLLTTSQIAALEERAQTLSDTYQIDVVIVTVDSLDGWSAVSYADNFYDDYAYGVGEDRSGILFLLSMQEREWYIRTVGSAADLVSDGETEDLFDSIAEYLADDEYYAAFDKYVENLPAYLKASLWDTIGPIVISIGIGAVVAVIVLYVMRKQMNTATKQRNASSYLLSGSFDLRRRQDIFLYSNVSRVRRQQSSGGNGGGGSSHRGGSGGHF